jgi:transposase
MKRERRKFTNAFKTEVVLEALKEKMSIAQLAEKYKLYPTQISSWKAEFLEKSGTVFGVDQSETEKERAEKQKTVEELYAEIGRQKMQIEWLKKKLQ